MPRVVLPKHAIFNEQEKFVLLFTFGIIRIFKDILKGKFQFVHSDKIQTGIYCEIQSYVRRIIDTSNTLYIFRLY